MNNLDLLPTQIIESTAFEPNTGCWLRMVAFSARHYAAVHWEGKSWPAHRLVWTLVNGTIPDGLWVLHRCDVGICINPDHLFLGTQADNNRDMWNKGRHNFQVNPGLRSGAASAHWTQRMPDKVARGARVGTAKMTDERVVAICDAAAVGMPQRHIARLVGLSQSTVWSIIHGNSWKHVQCPARHDDRKAAS